jgi:hypothetical protein
MTVTVANTNLNDSFNSWRLNTNYAATILSNNVVTVARAGSANRGGYAKGNGHVDGTFTANELRTTTLRAGNTSNDGAWLNVLSNTVVNATSLLVWSNTVFHGNVNFNTSGTDRLILGDISRLRLTGGTAGQFLRMDTGSDTPDFKTLELRDFPELSLNHGNLTFTGANSTFSDNGDSTHLIFTSGTDTFHMYLAKDGTNFDSDLYLNLTDDDDDSAFVIANRSNNRVAYVTSQGSIYASNAFMDYVTANTTILPATDDAVDLGTANREFRDLYIDGVANIDELSIATGSGQGVSTSLIPKTDAAGNLGSSTRKWGTAWADTTNGGSGVFNTMGISGTLQANGATTLRSTLAVTSTSTLTGAVTAQDTLTVTNATILNGDVTLGNASSDTITVKGNFANQSTEGTATFNGDVNIGDATSDTLTITARVDSDIDPATHDTYTMGSNHLRWSEIWANNIVANTITANTDLTVGGDLTVVGDLNISSGSAVAAPTGSFTTLDVTGNANIDGNIDLGNAISDSISFNGRIDTDIIPLTDGNKNLGTASVEWNDLYIDGTAHIDTLDVDENAQIDGTLTVTSSVDFNSDADISGKLSNDGTTIIGANGKLHANNTISDDTITNDMIKYANLDFTVTDGGTKITSDVKALGGKVQLDSGEGLSWSKAANGAYTISGENATTSNKGVASFASDNFSVSSGAVSIKTGGVGSTELASTGVTSGTYGNSSSIPTVTVDVDGRITSISESDVAGVTEISYTQSNNTVKIDTADGSNFTATIDAAGTTSGTTRGVASFDSGDFSLSSGHVSLKNATTGAVLAVSGTSKEVTVSRTNGTVTVGLPDDVTITSDLMVGGGLFVSGNLTVSGTTTTINTEQMNVANTYMLLNSDLGGSTAPTENAGMIVNRGSSTDVQVRWNESSDRWQFTNNGSTYYNIPKSDEYDKYVSWSIQDGNSNTTAYSITSADTLTIAQGNGIDSTLTADDTLKITNIKPFDYFAVKDGDGTEIHITNKKEWKFVQGTGMQVNWTDTSTGSGADPYDLQFTNTDRGSSQDIVKGYHVDDTDTEYTWSSYGTYTVSGNDDDLTFVSGARINLDIDTTTGAIRVTADEQAPIAGSGIDVSGTTVSVENDLRGDVAQMGYSTSDYYKSLASSHEWYTNGLLDMQLQSNGDLHVEGDVVSSSTSISSDLKLKDNITTVTDALNKVKQLNGVEFTWKKDGKASAGVIAQDVEKVLPQAVKEVDSLNDDTGTYKTVKYDSLHALLIEAIKELSAEIDELKKNK